MSKPDVEAIRARAAHSTRKWDILQAQCDLQDLLTEIGRLRARISTCRFCGQEVVEGAGGHTSACYERKLDLIRQALLIDDYQETEDKIREVLEEDQPVHER